jgi:iron-sulfur cluster assembly accessory protein
MTAAAEIVLSLTEAATAQVRLLLGRESDPSKRHLRVYVERGGCSGMQYGLVFDEFRPDDQVHDFNGVKVVVDPYSSGFLKGTVVDFVDALNGGGFKIRNPNARQSCGCGNSFET